MLSRIIDGGRRFLDQERLVRASGLFDAEWYAGRYPEAGGKDRALAHFLRTGARDGNDPGPGFSAARYLADYPDVRAARYSPLLHYLRFGRHEGRVARDIHGRPTGAADGRDTADAGHALAEGAFDAEFYLATNPDLPADTDAFAHFIGRGWRQRRDPASWFSVERYLDAHPDVAGSGVNPFVHYLRSGCREGRSVHPSGRPSHGPAPGRDGRPRIAVVAMVKNEADIIRSFTAHVLALFDEVVIVDHRSDDGTAEFLAGLASGNRRIELLHLDVPAYIQSVAMTHVVRDRPQIEAADWVFFLDADEFLPFPDRDAFHAALAPFAGCPTITMRWQNLIPAQYWDGEASVGEATEFLVPPALSPYRKVAFQPRRLPLSRLVVQQGNHALAEGANGLEIPAFEADFPLLHVPVRSADQLVLKLNQGVLAYQRIGKARDPGQGTHWFKMKEATAQGSVTPELLNAVAMNYSEEKERFDPVPAAALIKAGYRPRSIAVAQAPLPDADLPRRGLGEQLMRLYAADPGDGAPGPARLETRDGRLVGSDDEAEYAALPTGGPVGETEVPPLAALQQFLRPSYHEIADLVPSDWTGHIPAMFALATLLHPRRYVELGTLRGASFFAYAQTVRRAGFDSEAVAVSSWAVGPERAEEFRTAQDDFRFIARKYADFTGILRMGYAEAAHRFSEGSVDLLHLDGFSDYEWLSDTFRIWRPKLSDRGVVLVHDTNAHGPDFGVWRFWEELSAEVPALAFRHDQGLGVACVGHACPPALRALAGAAASDRDLATILQEHFGRLGQMSAELFSRRYDMAQSEKRAAAEGATAEELSWLRQEIASARAEADELRELLRGEIGHAAGA